jgi:hypothetical protein
MKHFLTEAGWAIGGLFCLVACLLALWAVLSLGNYVLTRVF